MNYALLISILMLSRLCAFEFAIAPGVDADSLILNKPSNFITELTSSGGWMRTDKGDVEYGSCVYKDPRGKFSVGWEHSAGKVRRIYFSSGPNRIALNESTLVEVSEGQEVVLDTETGELKVVDKAKRKSQKQAELGGADQPATTSESKSESNAKPQPESKPAPR